MRWSFGDFVLDSEAYDLRRDGEPIAVEPRVFDLLAYLVAHRDRVVSKDELLREVWEGLHVGESVLTQSIYEARRALGDDAGRQESVKTVYGRGYQFVARVESEEGGDVGTAEGSSDNSGPGPTQSREASSQWLWTAVFGISMLLIWGLLLRDRSSTVESASRTDPTPVTVESESTPQRTVDRLAIVPFLPEDDLAEGALTALSVSDQLWYRLASQPGLVVRTLEMGSALQAAELPWTVMLDEASVDAVLSGRLEPSALEERFQLTVWLHERAPDGRPRDVVVGTYEVPAMSSRSALERFVQVRNAIADDVVEHLRPALESRDLEALAPEDPEAWRLYLQSRERFATIT